jgi:AhpD family alkylhydroperoxidase
MANEIKEFFENYRNDIAKMKEQTPDLVNAFAGLFTKVMKNGALSVMQKELIALGIGVTQHCAPCIRLHIQKALEAGATKEQVLEAAAVAVVMGGGPAYTHIPIVINTLEALD